MAAALAQFAEPQPLQSSLRFRNSFFNGLALRRRTRFRIQRNVAAFLCGREHSSEFHGFTPVGLMIIRPALEGLTLEVRRKWQVNRGKLRVRVDGLVRGRGFTK